MKVYVVANLKGGVGKTTTTVNVAYTFSEMGGRVLVIDLDPQCNCTRFFAKVNGYSKTVREVLENPKAINSTVYRTKYQDIDIVKGSVKITEQKTPWRLKEALGYLKKDYDVCLIDTRPVFDMLTKNALYAADVFLTPVKLITSAGIISQWWKMLIMRFWKTIQTLSSHVSAVQRLLIMRYPFISRWQSIVL